MGYYGVTMGWWGMKWPNIADILSGHLSLRKAGAGRFGTNNVAAI